MLSFALLYDIPTLYVRSHSFTCRQAGVDLPLIVKAGAFISGALGRASGSKVNIAMENKRAKDAKAAAASATAKL